MEIFTCGMPGSIFSYEMHLTKMGASPIKFKKTYLHENDLAKFHGRLILIL